MGLVDDPDHGRLLGAAEYLVKPVSPDKLLAAVERAGALQRRP